MRQEPKSKKKLNPEKKLQQDVINSVLYSIRMSRTLLHVRLVKDIEREEVLMSLFLKASITLIPNPEKTELKKNY